MVWWRCRRSCRLEGDVEITVHFAQGKVAGGVDRKREHPWFFGETGGGSIPLMHIEIQQHQLVYVAVIQQHPGGYSAVIEDAKAAAEAWMSVVGPTGQV